MGSSWVGFSRGAAQPFIYFDSLPPLSAFAGTFDGGPLGSGGVWIRSQELASTAPAESFIGFSIEQGSLRLSAAVPVPIGVGSTLDVLNRDLTLSLTIRQAPQNNRPSSTLTVPTVAVFKFTNATRGRLDLSQSVIFNVFGTTMELNYLTPSQAEYDEVLGRINIPFGVASNTPVFQLQQGSTELVDFVEGHIPVTHAMWSFQESVVLTVSSSIAGAGSALISLGPGLHASPKIYGKGSQPMVCGPSYLLVEPHRMRLGNIKPTASFGKYRIGLPQRANVVADGAAGRAQYLFEQQDSAQRWDLKAPTTAFLDLPRTANGGKLNIVGMGDMSITQDSSAGPTSLSFHLTPRQSATNTLLTFALKNLLVKARYPALLEAGGLLVDGFLQSGSLSFKGDLVFTMPFLPDPYATDASLPLPGSPETSPVGKILLRCDWTSVQDFLVNVELPNGAMSRVGWSTSGANKYPDDQQGQNLLLEEESQFNGALGGKVEGPAFLDLSSNASQFGVVFDVSSLESDIKVQDLLLQAPVRIQNVFTLPTVEWEPIFTAEKDQDNLHPFPNPFNFPNSGPAGRIGANSVSLVPISPEGALNGVLNAYNALSSGPTVAEFSLPFGIIAFAKLRRPLIVSPLFSTPSLSIIRPRFRGLGLEGATQLSISAAVPSLISLDQLRAPAIPGAAIMLKFRPGVLRPSDPALSVLGAGATVRDFNDDFGPTASAAGGRHGPLVPANRADISGYGLSMFSEWQFHMPVLPTNEKVDIEVLLGRAEKQVIQQVYRCLPHAAKFTRVITMERQNNGTIYRTSVLKAASDGMYQFDDPRIVTHPGLVRAYMNIRNIRDGPGEPVTLTDGTTLSPVLYDADVKVEALGVGNSITTAAINHKGYIVTGDGHPTGPTGGPNPVSFGPAQYQEFMTKHGDELGGPIDCEIPLFGLRIKLMSTAVDFALRASQPEFVVGVGTMVEFQGMGEWSFLQLDDNADAKYVGRSGVPLIREGSSTVATALSTPFRFAYPKDLLSRRSNADFCILHTTHSQRVLFPQPKIEADGLNRITSLRVPHIADPFALAYSSGPFPKLRTCIPFENPSTSPANYSLQIGSQGHLRLQLPQATFTTPVPQRTFQDSDSVGVFVDTASDANKESKVTLMIDSASPNPWDFNVTNIGLVNQSGDRTNRTEITRISGNVVCSPGTTPKMIDSSFTVGGPLGPVFEVLAFLQNLGSQPPMEMSLTNDWSFYVGVRFGVDKFLERLDAGTRSFLEKTFEKLDFTIESNVRTLAQTTTLGVQVIFWLPSPWEPLKFLVNAQFRLVFATTNNIGLDRIPPPSIPTNTALSPPPARGGYTVELGLGAGIGVKFDVLTLKAVGYVLLTQSVIFNTESGNWGLGTSLLLKADVTIIPEVLSAGISIETKMMMLFINCMRPELPAPGARPAPKTIWGVAQVTIGIHVDLFLIVSIEFEVQAEWSTRFNGGPCRLDEFSAIGI